MRLTSKWLWLVPALALGACSEGTVPGGTFDPDASLSDDITLGDDVIVKTDVVGADSTQITDVVETDGGIIKNDTGVIGSDTGVVDTDTGVIGSDTGVVDTDTGVIGSDTGVVDTDTGVIGSDTGVVDTDAGTSSDTGVVGTDTGVVGSDTGVVDTDAGTSSDTGVVDTDTGVVTDAGTATDTGMSTDGGATAPANDLPGGALTLNLATPVVTVMGTTVGATRQGSCGAAAEVYYRFTLTRREVVSVNSFGSAYDTTVALTNATGTQLTGACNDDSSCGGLQSSYNAVLDAGTYLVAVGGFGSNTGAFVLNFNHLPVGNGPAVEVTNTAAGVRTYTGTTTGTGTVTQACGGGATGPENTYWFATCPSFVSTPILASTCGGATWDTVVEQRSTNRSAAVCNDDGSPGCGVRSRASGTLTAGAGLHAVYVDGYNGGSGAYSVALAFGNCATGQNLCSTACSDLQSDPANCGNCGTACAMGQTCSAGVCGTSCPTGQTNCSNACVNTTTSIAHCGGCGRACTVTNGTPSCAASTCGIAACNAGFGNCDSNAANGCETNTGNSLTNCGACGTACTAANGTPVCTAGSCGVGSCNAGFGNCDNNAANGCEVNTATSATNCGACGRACTVANGTAGCAASACTVAACNAGFGNCDGNATNGCETTLATTNAHCGACGNACATGTMCVAGVCRSGAPANDLPANAVTLNLSTPIVTVTGNNTGATTQGSCGGADVYYRFTLTQREIVWVNTFGSAFDTTVAVANSTGTQLSGACNDDSACTGLQSSYGAVLAAGTYLVAVGGFSTNVGAFTLNLHHLPTGGGTLTEVTSTAAGIRNYTGTTAGTSGITQSCGGGNGPENAYWFTTCPSFVSTSLVASTCGGATWDTVIEQRSTNRTAAVCNDDGTPGCGLRSRTTGTLAAGAGLHTVYVDGLGSSSLGAYSLALSFGNCATGQNLCTAGCFDLQTSTAHCGSCGNACASGQSCTAGACVTPGPANDTRTNATALTLSAGEVTVSGNSTGATFDGPTGCGSNPPNVWYRVTLTGREVLYADTAGSAIDTRLYLTDANGALVANTCSDDANCTAGGFTSGLQSRFAVVLNAGTYYISVGGYTAGVAGAFTLHVQHIPTNYGNYFYDTAISGDATTSTVLVGTGVRSSSCGGSSSGEDVRWFMTCGAQTSLFSLCPRDNGTWTRQISTTTYDAAMYVYSGQSGTQPICNDDATTCAGTGGDTVSYGSRIETTMNRGINAIVVDERTQANGMRYTLRHIVR